MPRILNSFRRAGQNALTGLTDEGAILGLGENALSGLTALGGAFVAGPVAAGRALRAGSTRAYAPAFNELASSLTYQPRTNSGIAFQNALIDAGAGYQEAMRRNADPVAAQYGPLAGAAVQTLGAAAPMVVPVLPRAARAVQNAPRAGTRFRQQGIIVGPKSKTWRTADAAKAQAMESAGIDEIQIWRATGTFRGKDGKWRQEIPDNNARMIPQRGEALEYLSDAGHSEYPSTIGAAIDHPELFSAYPHLREGPVRMTNHTTGGEYYPDMPSPDGPYEAYGLPMKHRNGQLYDEPASRRTALHELQHGIQNHEGFARGGSPEDFSPRAIAEYMNLPGELEARATEARMSFSPEKRRLVSPAVSAALAKGAKRAGIRQRQAGVINVSGDPNFTRWFGSSKAVDAEGRPLVVYHGTTADIEAFAPTLLGKNTKAGSAKKGFFFAAEPDRAGYYAGIAEDRSYPQQRRMERQAQLDLSRAARTLTTLANKHYDGINWPSNAMQEISVLANPRVFHPKVVEQAKKVQGLRAQVEADRHAVNNRPNSLMWPSHQTGEGRVIYPTFLSLQNPRVVDFSGRPSTHASLSKEVSLARKNGNDGLIVNNIADPTVGTNYVVFDAAQIKSAIGNSGRWANSPSLTDQSPSVKAALAKGAEVRARMRP